MIKSSSPDLQQVLSVNPDRRYLERVEVCLSTEFPSCSGFLKISRIVPFVPLGLQFELNCGFLLIMQRDNDDRQLGWNLGCTVHGNAACFSTQTIAKGE